MMNWCPQDSETSVSLPHCHPWIKTLTRAARIITKNSIQRNGQPPYVQENLYDCLHIRSDLRVFSQSFCYENRPVLYLISRC
jgi:hypothetical protein